MFSCVWLHFKKCFEKYFLVFSCVLENTIENTFFTCFSHFLTFSRLPNEYIISFIPQYRNTNKTQKKNHQIRSHFLGCQTTETQTFWSNTETQTFSRFNEGLQSREAPRWLRSARCFARSRWSWWTILADDLGDWSFGRSLYFVAELFLSLALSLFCVWLGNGLKVKWNCKTISGSNEQNFGQTEIIFRKFYFP